MHTTRFNPAFITIVVAVALFTAACSSGAGTTTTTQALATDTTPATSPPGEGAPIDYEGFRSQPTACGGEAPAPVEDMQFDEPGDASVSEAIVVTLNTSCGPIEITVDPSLADETVNSFVFLAESGYFDGSASHRVIPGFMIQAGDPTATGRGGPGYRLPDELPSGDFLYDTGVVAMANAGPGTSGSQFFIMVGEASWLPPNYSVFGYVTDGFETLTAIEQLPLALHPSGGDPSPSVPLETLYIESVVVRR
jgi:peptidyl-prolyl cis-trans isomerase B (cyclophilin B)